MGYLNIADFTGKKCPSAVRFTLNGATPPGMVAVAAARETGAASNPRFILLEG